MVTSQVSVNLRTNEETDPNQMVVSNQMESNQDNAVVSTEESCKKQANAFSFTMKTEMGKNIRIRGEKSILYRIRLPKVSESEDYTGFLAFDHTFCSFDFIQQFGDGRIM